ncbi:MAG: YggS family pyridoxal phosphate-dependent enzyme [Deltaproteobacteria bacterium]|nr:YggS family pyridoxal phosphate-dependent enzyme [Candidatus Deferrimicrobiaceae bacterium]
MEGTVKDRAARVLDRVERAAVRSGRSPGSIRLVAVSKTHPVERVAEAYAAGLRVFGENYVQEAEEKVRAFPDAEWHLIGRLQSNKARKAASLFGWVQSVDSLRLLAELSRRCVEGGKRMPVLIEVNLAGEESKAGVPPGELPALLSSAAALQGVRVRGLMAIPPMTEDPEESRPYFARLRELLGRCATLEGAGGELTELSMGMSNDFEAAIEEGATMVRVGTAIFGSRARRAG